MGRTRTLLVAVLALLAAPASALAGPCLDATTGIASEVTSSSATLNASIDPRGQLPTYRFDVGPTMAYGSSTPSRTTTVSTPANITEKLANLTPGTTYHFRVVASTVCGSEIGLDATFTTPLATGQPPIPVVPLVFTSYLTGNAEITIAGSDGSGPRVIAPSPASDFDPALSPDWSRVVFTQHAQRQRRPLHRRAGRQRARAAHELALRRHEPCLVARWRQIVFASANAAGPGLFVVNADGTGRRRLTTEKAGASDPAWSPNGQTIAFVRSVKGTAPEIYTVPAAGGVATRLTRNTVPDLSPAWSPDGTRLAVTRFTSIGGSTIVVFPVAGGLGVTVTAAADFGRNATWTRDGTRIAYIGLGGGKPALTIVQLGGGPTLRLLPLTP